MKAALKMMGIKAGRSRMPLDSGGTLTPETKDEIRMELEKLGLIESLAHDPVRELDLNPLFRDFGIENDVLEGCKVGRATNSTVSAAIAYGPKGGPLGWAFVRLLTRAKVGYEALSVILEPNLPVRPSSIMVPARRITSLRQASLFYGPVQAGAARAVAALLADGRIPSEEARGAVMVMALDVDLNERDRRAVAAAAEDAVKAALSQIWG